MAQRQVSPLLPGTCAPSWRPWARTWPGPGTPPYCWSASPPPCAGAGLDPATVAGHSLWAGLATAAAAAGASERAIMAQTGHRSTAMVRRYIRSGELFRDNAAAVVGL